MYLNENKRLKVYYIIVFHKETAIGMLRHFTRETEALFNLYKVKKGKYKHIQIVYVSKKYRKLGLCKKMMKMIKGRSVLRVLKQNRGAVRCYEKSGYTVLQEDDTHYLMCIKKTERSR